MSKYSRPEGLISLVDIAALIIEETEPSLLDCMDFDEESYLLDMHVDSAQALQLFASVICPVYQNLDLVENYTKRITNG